MYKEKMSYNCSLRGECVPDFYGPYNTLEECQAQCTGSENVDLIYLILSYDWETAQLLSSVDKQELIWREFKLRVASYEAKAIIDSLAKRDFMYLLKLSPSFREYVEERISDFEIFLLQVADLARVKAFYWMAFAKDAQEGIVRILNTYNPNVYDIDGLVGFIVFSLCTSTDSSCQGNYQSIADLVYGWLPELFRLFAPEKLYVLEA